MAAQSSTLLPGDHWSRGALQRLAVTGELDAGAAMLSWPARRSEVAAWFSQAVASAQQRGNPASLRRAQLYRDLLAAELGPDRIVHAAMVAGGESVRGALRAGSMQRVNDAYDYPGPDSLSDYRVGLLAAELFSGAALPIAVAAQGDLHGQHAELSTAYVMARVGAFETWAGRRPFGFGNSIVLNETMTLDGAGLSSRTGLHAPLVGRVRPELVVARMQRSGAVSHPWFTAARITFTPAATAAISLSRAAIFGGDTNVEVTPARVLLMALGFSDVGAKDSDFENQVASISAWWRTRIGGTPLHLYGEMAADDTGWAFLHVPGIVAGFEAGEVPGMPALAAGVEVTHLAERCCGYPPWYQHGALADGWTDRGQLLGHPLGGVGTEIALPWRLDFAANPLVTSGRMFVRWRGAENLLSPSHEGRSTGAQLDVLVPWRRVQVQLRGSVEAGGGWTATGATAIGRIRIKG